MGTSEQRIQAFVKLGEFLRAFGRYKLGETSPPEMHKSFAELDTVVTMAGHKNGWFTEDNLLFSFSAWGKVLTLDGINNWLTSYTLKNKPSKHVAIIMAGNIPLVGFHDLLAVVLTGNKSLIKPSSNDPDLLPFFINLLETFEPALKGSMIIAKGTLSNFDAVIATGSNNTARYFEYYFGHKPNIIRKNRNSIAILTGSESKEQLNDLGEDIFRYFGLGCRSVSKIFVPQGYNFDLFFKAIESYSFLKDHHKYHNNYDYNKAVYLMSEFPFLDNNFFMLKEDENYASPIGTVFYEQYESLDRLLAKLKKEKDQIQCVVSQGVVDNEIPFGSTQSPLLTDYADGVDTVEFLLKT
ncbi:MAG: acyl-CoA reductase [Eudoraea sp.]|nr:acyl-CoA reductase [Eudoraea sp.]